MCNIDTPEIRELLAQLYNSIGLAQIIAQDAGLSLSTINFGPTMIECWSNILKEAERRNKELNLIRRTLKDFPDNNKLIQIQIELQLPEQDTQTNPPPTVPLPPQTPQSQGSSDNNLDAKA